MNYETLEKWSDFICGFLCGMGAMMVIFLLVVSFAW